MLMVSGVYRSWGSEFSRVKCVLGLQQELQVEKEQ